MRVSTEEQAREGYSLAGQETDIRARAVVDGVALEDDHLYADRGLSGSRSDRPAYQAMLAAAAAGEFSVLYVWKFDRLGRDAEELLRARRMLEAAGVRLVSLTEGEAEGTLIYGVRALVAQEEREKLAERTRAGLRAIAASGRPPCGAAPLGYRAVGERRDRRWVVDEAEAEIVRSIFAAYLDGAGVSQIARRLNAQQIRTRGGSKFATRVVAGLLDNPAYVGRFQFKGEVFEGEHVPILDERTWERARRLRESRREAAGNGRGRPPAGGHLFVGGLLRCGLCGRAMTPRTISSTGHSYYACSRRHVYGDCEMPLVRRERVDESFLRFFERHVLAPDAAVAAVRDEAERRVRESEALAGRADRELAQAEAGRARADRAFLDGSLDEETYERLRGITEEDSAAASAEAEHHRSQALRLAAEAALLDAEWEMAERLVRLRLAVAGELEDAQSTEALRAVVTALCERVELLVDGDGIELVPHVRGPAWADAATLRLPPSKAGDFQGEEMEATAPSPPGRPCRAGRRS